GPRVPRRARGRRRRTPREPGVRGGGGHARPRRARAGGRGAMDVIDALRAGHAVLLPSDGVYGLCALAESDAAVRALYALKGRGEAQPTQVIAASGDVLADAIPELPRPLLEDLLPGAYTLALPNPARRFSWLTGERPDTIGVRVARVPPATQDVLDAVGLVAATSANEPGEPPAASLAAVPRR